MPEELLGLWVQLAEGTEGLVSGEEAHIEFFPDGRLVYTLHTIRGDQKIFLTYRVEKNTEALVTNQPSCRREERTSFMFLENGDLILTYGFNSLVYRRVDIC